MSSTARPQDSGRKDALGRTIRVSGADVAARSDAPAPPVASTKVERGVWVRSDRHGHTGRVTAVHADCPESRRRGSPGKTRRSATATVEASGCRSCVTVADRLLSRSRR